LRPARFQHHQPTLVVPRTLQNAITQDKINAPELDKTRLQKQIRQLRNSPLQCERMFDHDPFRRGTELYQGLADRRSAAMGFQGQPKKHDAGAWPGCICIRINEFARQMPHITWFVVQNGGLPSHDLGIYHRHGLRHMAQKPRDRQTCATDLDNMTDACQRMSCNDLANGCGWAAEMWQPCASIPWCVWPVCQFLFGLCHGGIPSSRETGFDACLCPVEVAGAAKT
jgi:hypothetical protein